MFNNEEENKLDFELPIDECDTNFDIDENKETFADKKLEKKKKSEHFI